MESGKTWDLSKIDFERLKEDFACTRHKNLPRDQRRQADQRGLAALRIALSQPPLAAPLTSFTSTTLEYKCGFTIRGARRSNGSRKADRRCNGCGSPCQRFWANEVRLLVAPARGRPLDAIPLREDVPAHLGAAAFGERCCRQDAVGGEGKDKQRMSKRSQ